MSEVTLAEEAVELGTLSVDVSRILILEAGIPSSLVAT
jgi:hypothetical protein